MARRFTDQDHGTDKGKIRFIIAEVEGSNQTLQELVKAIGPMLARSSQIALPPKANNAISDGGPPLAPLVPTLFGPEDDSESAVEEQTNEEKVDENQNTLPRRKRGDGPKSDHNTGIALVPNLNFVPSGKLALKAFFGEKSPTNHMGQMLVFAHYLQCVVGLGEFGPAHLLTAFKHVGKPVPADLRQTIRNMKLKKNWVTFTDISKVKLTTEGENQVEHELPRKSGKNGTN